MSAYHFFLRYGGYNYNPSTETPQQGRIRCAKEYAKAEQEAVRFGITFHWENDPDIDDSWMDEDDRAKEHTWETCAAYTPDGRLVASLGQIVDATPEYRRVVEAELAQEALATVEHR